MPKYKWTGPDNTLAPTIGKLLNSGDVVELDSDPNNPNFEPVATKKKTKDGDK